MESADFGQTCIARLVLLVNMPNNQLRAEVILELVVAGRTSCDGNFVDRILWASVVQAVCIVIGLNQAPVTAPLNVRLRPSLWKTIKAGSVADWNQFILGRHLKLLLDV